MLFLPFLSVKYKINDKETAKATFTECLTELAMTVTDVTKIEVLEGDFPATELDAFVPCTNLVTLSFVDIVKPAVLAFPDIFKNLEKLETVDLGPYTSVAPSAFKALKTFTANKFTEIPASCFAKLATLTTVTINEAAKIGESAFMECPTLTDVHAPKAATVGKAAFQKCPLLATVELPEATELSENAFQASGITTFTAAKLTTILGFAFQDSSKLVTVTIPAIEQLHESSFQNCVELTSITAENCNLIGKNVFSGCTKLTATKFPKIRHIVEGAFLGCTSLATFDFSAIQFLDPFAFSGSGLTSADLTVAGALSHDTFKNCLSLKNVIANQIATIFASCFEGCVKLETAQFDGVINVNTLAFSGCLELTSVKLPICETIDENAFALCSKLTTVAGDKLKTIKQLAFSKSSALKAIDLSHVTTMGDNAFEQTGLDKVDLGSLTIIPNSAFISSALKTIDKFAAKTISESAFLGTKLEKFESSATEIIKDGAFQNCALLQTVVLSNIVEIGRNSFESCIALVSFSAESKKDIKLKMKALSGCKLLKDVKLSSIEEIDINVFNECPALKELNLSVTTLDKQAFGANCGVQNLTISKLVTFGEMKISTSLPHLKNLHASNIESLPDSFFVGCAELVFVELPSVKTLFGDCTFSGCLRLENISMISLETVDPKSTKIFFGCESLIGLELKETTPPKTFSKDSFSSSKNVNLVLSHSDGYITYDNNVDIEGDVAGDHKWCGIALPIPSPPDDKRKSYTSLIIGVALGAVFLLIGTIGIIYYIRHRSMQKILAGDPLVTINDTLMHDFE